MATAPKFTTSDMSRRSGDILAAAMRQPVTLTQRNKPRVIVMNVEDYEEMRRRADPRRAVTLEELTQHVSIAEMRTALETYLADDDSK